MSNSNYFHLAQECSKNGQIQEAIEYYKKEIEENPSSFPAIFNLILLLKKTQSPELIKYVETGLKLSPKDENLYSILGEFYLAHEKKEYALFAFQEAHKINPENFVYSFNIATILYKMTNYSDARAIYEQLLEKDKNNISVLVCLAQTYKHLHESQKAVELYEHCCELEPENLKAKLNLAITYNTAERPEEALKIYNQLLDTNLNKIDVFKGIGISYRKLHKYDSALEYFKRALALKPDDLDTMTYIADMYMYYEKEETTEMLIEQILEKNPHFTPAILYKDILKLRKKDFSGFEYYRMKNLEFEGSGFVSVYRHKAWQGESFKDKTVVVACNCGIGDTIMYSRYLPELVKRAKKVIVVVNKPLEKLFRENFPKCTIITDFKDMPFDILLNMAILPYYLKANNRLPKGKNSLKINKELVKEISKHEILQNKKKKIAITWRGAKKTMLEREIPLTKLQSLFDIEDAVFYSFQFDCSEEEQEILAKYSNIIDMKPYIRDYSDTAAFLTQMDRVVSIDTSLIHMAGVVGAKSYLMLPFEHEWRWYGGKKGISPWYETVKMFRQEPDCRWDKVVENVKSELVRNL